jgi:peptidoglycan/LPS O-acetylase OafA/YrhL
VSAKFAATPKQTWILSRVYGYLPLHLSALLLFAPVFLYTDVHYSGWGTAALHGLLSVTLTQAWFPMHAEIWNAPTWFLSALTFCTMVLPYSLPALAALNTPGLVKTGYWIWIVYLLPKLGYLHDCNAWTVVEGVTAPRAHPNWAVFNTQRFSPVFAVAEVLLGVIACRIVMLDGGADKDKEVKARKTNALSTVVPLLALVGLMGARAVDALTISDMLFRGALFVPLFLRLLMAVHRNTVNGTTDPIVGILGNSKLLVWLGNLSFPIFIVHGPVGQIFYKKLIATYLFGHVLTGPANFAMYLLSTLICAWILQQAVLQNGSVKKWSQKSVDRLSAWM